MSSSSNFILRILKTVGFKDQARRQFQNPPRETGTLNPRKVRRPLSAEGWTVDGFQLLTISPKEPKPQHLIYLPGGAYLLEATPFHRKFVEKLVKLTGIPATIIDYPKAPEHTFQTTHQLISKAYQALRERYPEALLLLGGDSAGGGLALAFRQSLRDQEVAPLPDKLVLISPWLDLSLSHPDIPAFVERDLILPLDGLQRAAQLYAGDEDLRHPLLSPLQEDLHDLGQILLLFGTEEIFYPDCQLLIKRAQTAPGTELSSIIRDDQVHAWPIFPFPDSKAAVERIAAFLSSD